ncbi:MAG TPA: NAD(P)/FAD-dependent oxidoreductase [Caulobacteraceae bacterium]|jgi:4-hydroxyacetophenone monooxygenase|nr:NAD(P)/FAD-dependent oxidoreductase [Caulobacteraceae bacterium]
MTDTVTLDEALAEAHLPVLVAALVHMTSDASLVSRANWPAYDPFGEARTGGFPEAVQADIRQRAKAALEAHASGVPMPPPPSEATVRQMMDFVAGTEIPDHYAPFLMEELQLPGHDTKTPHWTSPALRAAAPNMPVVIVGAGMSGLLAGIRLKEAGVPFTIIEKNADVGGTWFENRYPDCRVDNPSHLYSYSFEPNHDWPNHFSPQPVLLAYFQRTADKHGLRPHIRFETQVQDCTFDEAAAVWRVRIAGKGGKIETLTAKAVISAVGQLNQPRFPDIPGVADFKGPAFHSARWRHDVDLKGKRVAVIGTGASAFQFVPEVAKVAAQLTVFQRTPPWLAPTPDYHHPTTPAERWLLEHVPYYEKWYRFWLFWMLTDGIYEAVKADPTWSGGPGAVSPANAMMREMISAAIAAQAGDAPELLAHLIPAYPLGGKRILRDDGLWVAALKRDNVELVTEPIAKITEIGIETADGKAREFDVVIYGTGFTASQFLRTFRITGRDGRELHDVWAGDARAYLGMTTPGFPNFFMIYGPNTNIVVNGSIIFFSECSVRYIVNCLKLMAETGAETLEVRRDVHDAFNAKVDAANAQMAWGAPQVSSWYKNDLGRVSQNWPFPLVDYWTRTLAPNPADFVLGAKVADRVPLALEGRG